MSCIRIEGVREGTADLIGEVGPETLKKDPAWAKGIRRRVRVVAVQGPEAP